LIRPATDKSDAFVTARICHMIAASDDGPRGDAHVSAALRDHPDNLLLLCGTHHDIVDGQFETYPVALLREWKAWQERDTARNIASYRAAIRRHLASEADEAVLFRRQAGATPVAATLTAWSGDGPVARGLDPILSALKKPLTFVVGRSGAGKSTLLNQIALSGVEREVRTAAVPVAAPLPILINGGRFSGSLFDLIAREALNATGIEIDLRGLSGAGLPLLLLCDDFQHCPDRRLLLEQLRALTSQFEGARCVVFTHELADSSLFDTGNIPAFRLGELDDEGMLELFGGFMDGEAAETLLDELSERAEQEGFRLPLLAALVAADQARLHEPGDRELGPTRRGELFRRVVLDGVLRAWRATRSPTLTSPAVTATARHLGNLAAYLVDRDIEVVARLAAALAAGGDAHGAGDAIDQAIGCGLLRGHGDDLSFAHVAIRDYFAAEYLLVGPPRLVARAWFRPRWHGALRNFASLWPNDKARLYWLRLCGWVSLRLIFVLRLRSSRYLTRLFYFMLEFAAESRLRERWLLYGIFERYSEGSTFLDVSVAPDARVFVSMWEDGYAHVYRLFGRLGDERINAWLREPGQGRRRYKVQGIRQDRSQAGLTALWQGIGSDGDGIADDFAIELAFDYPRSDLRTVFERFVEDGGAPLGRLIGAIYKGFQVRSQSWNPRELRRGRRRNRIGVVISEDGYWRDTLIRLSLDEREDVARSAGHLLRCIGGDGSLRPDIEAILVDILSQGNSLERGRAALLLIHAKKPTSLAALKRRLAEDDDGDVCCSLCDALLWREPREAPEHFRILLQRCGTLDPDLCKAGKQEIDAFVRAWSATGHKPYRKYVRFFLVYLRCGVTAFEKIVAALALAKLRGPMIGQALSQQMEAETNETVRYRIAKVWAPHPEVPLDEAVRALLASPDPDIRSLAASTIRSRREMPDPSLYARVQAHVEADPDPDVRRQLERALELIDGLIKSGKVDRLIP
jgi:hypothetical protein